MSPRHHPPEDLLLDYAAGRCPEAVDLILATHLALCPRCRAELSLLEGAAGAALDGIPAVQGAPGALEALLSRLDEPAPPRAPRPPPPSGETALLPEPLRSYVGPLSGERWTAVVPGLVQRIELGVELDGRPVTLARVRGGLGIPRHAHQGRELTLVLSGGLIDRGEDYERGDFALAEVGDEHEPEIQDGTPCLLLAVTEAPTLPRGWYSRVVDWLAG